MPPPPCTISSADSESHCGELETLVRWFDTQLGQLGHFEPVAAGELPADFSTLLVHHSHMTVAVEAFHKSRVDVRVLTEHREADLYGRQIVLTRRSDGAVVQYGIMRIDMRRLSEKARREVETHAAPLGRVLIRHKALREVELIALWKIEPSNALAAHLNIPTGEPVYGRSARILLDKRPAVELLEIVKV
ncbi:MAG: hypothetical protein WD851_13300 [Pirellulales bacterium]